MRYDEYVVCTKSKQNINVKQENVFTKTASEKIKECRILQL